MSNHRNLKDLFYNKYGFVKSPQQSPHSYFNKDIQTERHRLAKSPLSFSQFQSYFQLKGPSKNDSRPQSGRTTPTKVRVVQLNMSKEQNIQNCNHSRNISQNHIRNNSLIKDVKPEQTKVQVQAAQLQSLIQPQTKPAFLDNSDILNRKSQIRQQSKSPNSSLSKISVFTSAKPKENNKACNDVPQIIIQKNASSNYKIRGEFKSFENLFQMMNQQQSRFENSKQSVLQKQNFERIEIEDDQDDELLVDNYNGLIKSNFIFHYVIGKGGFGKVWKVELKKNRSLYAMKEMSKAKIISKRSVNSVMNERNLLSNLKHQNLVNISYAFQDRDNLYLIMDLLTGGDLRYHIGRMRKFKEHQTKFFVACVVLALEYLHNNNVIHRDLKPENLVLDHKGYVRLTDLGIARIWKQENSCDTSGTPGYMAPEVMCRQNHTIAVDYFALGVMTYEFMLGRRPYQGRTRQEIRDQILTRQVQIKKSEIPEDWSVEAADFVNRLIQRKPANRLGFRGPDEVKNHPWLRNYPFIKLLNKEIDSPYIPRTIEDNAEYLNQISEDNDSQDEVIKENILLLKKNSVQNLFAGYSYDQNVVRNTKSTVSTGVIF